MGNTLQSFTSSVFSVDRPRRLLILGLDNAGKTTILNRLRIGTTEVSTPTIGLTVEAVSYKNLKFLVWDLSGEEKLRPLWRRYFDSTDAIIFVVDSSDTSRMSIAKKELAALLKEEKLRNAILLVFANKQDLPNAQSLVDIAVELELHLYSETRTWYIQGSCGTSGEGLFEGMDWLAAQIKKKNL